MAKKDGYKMTKREECPICKISQYEKMKKYHYLKNNPSFLGSATWCDNHRKEFQGWLDDQA
jgi:hypothetical protein